ncbi:MAG: hypothetical protein ACLRM4_09315 [Anaerostipes sp.]|uniref:hypothetical protein n=1 Tax=Anaerostipes sp. TaxID=1872530 RepID=UPI0039A2A80B
MTADRKTPECVAYILYKQPSATLSGQGYSSDVKYWMPFIGNVGFILHHGEVLLEEAIYIQWISWMCQSSNICCGYIIQTVSQGDPVVTYY